MTNDLISRSALLEALENEKIRIAVDKGKMFRHIEAAPAVDAVDVVRCKDCIHYEKTMLYSECWNELGMINVYDDCYCSRGERRTE